MDTFSLAHLSDETLTHELRALGRQESAVTARLLARIAEFESRDLHAKAGYPSMVAYLMRTLSHIFDSEHAAFNRIHAARAARAYPVIFSMVAGGELSLTAVNLLAPHLTAKNAADLLTAATDKTKIQVQELIAARFPKPDVPTVIQPLTPAIPTTHSFQNESGDISAAMPAPRIAPLSAERVLLQVTVDRETHDLLQRVQSLLGRSGSSHVSGVLKGRCAAMRARSRRRSSPPRIGRNVERGGRNPTAATSRPR